MRVFVGLSAASILVACTTEPNTVDKAGPPAPESPTDPRTRAPEDDGGEPPSTTPEDGADDAGVDEPPAPTGCEREPIGVGTVMQRETTANRLTRTYFVSIPSTFDAQRPHPVVFVLHGAGDRNPQKLREWFSVESELGEAVFVYPQALPRTRRDGTGDFLPRWDLYGDEDTSFYDAMMTEISEAYCVDTSRVLVTGFSSGGNFAHQLACLRQAEVRAIAAVAGQGPFTTSCGGPVAVWMSHDTDDPILPITTARDARTFWTTTNGCGAAWSPDRSPSCECNTSCPSETPLTYCETHGVGHQMPAFAVGAISNFFRGILSAPETFEANRNDSLEASPELPQRPPRRRARPARPE